MISQYGIVDEHNPYDKLQLTATMASSDPLFRLKRNNLAANQLSTMQTFDMSRSTPLPPTLLPFMRLALANNEAGVDAVAWGDAAGPVDQANETMAVELLVAYLDSRLARCVGALLMSTTKTWYHFAGRQVPNHD